MVEVGVAWLADDEEISVVHPDEVTAEAEPVAGTEPVVQAGPVAEAEPVVQAGPVEAPAAEEVAVAEQVDPAIDGLPAGPPADEPPGGAA
jgi:hypothetical protein